MSEHVTEDRAVALPDDGDARLPALHEGTYAPESLVLLSDPHGIEAETIRGLRTRVMAQHVQDGRRALAVCTPAMGSGCTFIATNLAVAVSQIGVKTVLVDANLRAPSLGDIFGVAPGSPGLAEYLADDSIDFEALTVNEVLDDLIVVHAGQIPSNPQELLSGPRFRMLVNQLFRAFDLTLFDTAPANTCSDAQRVATVAGYAMVVARRDYSYIDDVATLVKVLRADGSVVIGSVLNEHPASATGR